ncbi:MAG: VOC family protein [Promethearchaeota archaeon]
MENKSIIDLNTLGVAQLGYVYKDVEKQAQLMEITLGIPKFAILVGTNPIIYHGKELEYKAKIAISRWLNTQIELIQPLKGQSVHTEFLKKGKEGFHHISAFVEELEPYIEDFRNKGFQILQSGQIGKQFYVYFDTQKALGLLLEIQMT